eukprot:jgi/Undpi1/4903/HiC_scaffold_19.g08255.m1
MAPFPYVAILAIMACLVSSMVVEMSVYAYAGYMVEHLGVVDDKDEAGYYAGLMSSSFMIGRLFSSHLWGIAGDRLGQRFVLVFGIVSTTILSVVFGCSTTFAVAISSRFLLGLLNGATVVSRTLVSDVCGSEHETVGMGLVASSWTVGGILGPGVGGLLAEPATYHPATFSQHGLFGRYPYLLPNLIGAGLSFVALPLVLCSLQDLKLPASGIKTTDTLLDWYSSWRRSIGGIGGGKIEQCNRDGGGNGNKCGARVKYVSMHEPESPRTRDDDIPKRSRKPQVVLPTVMCPQVETGGSNQCSAVLGQDESKVEQESLLAQGNIRVLLLINGIYACVYSGFNEVYPLWALSSEAKGGLDWSTPQIGKVLFLCGVLVLALETLVVPHATPWLGINRSQRIGSVVEIPIYILLPMLSRAASCDGLQIFFTSVTLLVIYYAGSNAFYVGLALATNNAVSSRRRGELNGMSVTIESLGKAISPIVCSALFAVSIHGNRSYPIDHHFVFYLLGSTRLLIAFLAWNYTAGNETVKLNELRAFRKQ